MVRWSSSSSTKIEYDSREMEKTTSTRTDDPAEVHANPKEDAVARTVATVDENSKYRKSGFNGA